VSKILELPDGFKLRQFLDDTRHIKDENENELLIFLGEHKEKYMPTDNSKKIRCNICDKLWTTPDVLKQRTCYECSHRRKQLGYVKNKNYDEKKECARIKYKEQQAERRKTDARGRPRLVQEKELD